MELSEEARAELQAALRSDYYDGSVSSRARIVLMYADGHQKSEIAKLLRTTRPTVDKWLKRYAEEGMAGLVNLTSPGGPRQIPDEIRAKVLAWSRMSPPEALGLSHWTSGEMARYVKRTEGVYVSQAWVSLLWREVGLKPWQRGTFKISRDPEFEAKVRDVVGLYLNPPEGEVVVSVDVKSGIQALDRTQPMLPVTFGKTSKWTHDYKRMGTTEMYAALDVRTGKVITSLSKEHKAPDFLRLMKKVKAAYPDKKIHVVLDNASAHTGSVSTEWLVKQQGNVEFHFTPTGASWLNIVEIFNGIITRKAIRCGSFSAVVLLNKAIEAFVEHWNEDCEPIEWTATADEIIEKVRYVTARMEQLVNAVQIGDVMDKAA